MTIAFDRTEKGPKVNIDGRIIYPGRWRLETKGNMIGMTLDNEYIPVTEDDNLTILGDPAPAEAEDICDALSNTVFFNPNSSTGEPGEPVDTNSNTIKGLQTLGSAIKALPIGLPYMITQGFGRDMWPGNMYLIGFYLDKAGTINGGKVAMYTQGNYTATGYNGMVLFSVSGGILTRVASSTDDGNIWKAAAGTMITKAFSVPYAANPGLYYLGFQFNDNGSPVVRPQILVYTTTFTQLLNTMDFADSKFICGNYSSAGSSAPASITASAVNVSEPEPIVSALY